MSWLMSLYHVRSSLYSTYHSCHGNDVTMSCHAMSQSRITSSHVVIFDPCGIVSQIHDHYYAVKSEFLTLLYFIFFHLDQEMDAHKTLGNNNWHQFGTTTCHKLTQPQIGATTNWHNHLHVAVDWGLRGQRSGGGGARGRGDVLDRTALGAHWEPLFLKSIGGSGVRLSCTLSYIYIYTTHMQHTVTHGHVVRHESHIFVNLDVVIIQFSWVHI